MISKIICFVLSVLLVAACGQSPTFSEFRLKGELAEFEEGDLTLPENMPVEPSEKDSRSDSSTKLGSTMVTKDGEIFRSELLIDPLLLKQSPEMAPSSSRKNATSYPRSRVRDTAQLPYRSIGRIATGCTATLVSPRHVLTAGHCVYNVKKRKWYSNLSFSPGRNGKSYPYGTIGWKNVFAPDGWTKDKDWEFDYAIIELEEAIGEKLGWLGLKTANARTSGNIFIAGYPADKEYGTPWESTCPKTSEKGRKVYYRCETYGGMSGSAIRSRDAQSSKVVVEGVHGYGGASANSGTRISPDILAQLQQWLGLPVDVQPDPPEDSDSPGEETDPPVDTDPSVEPEPPSGLSGQYRGKVVSDDPEAAFPELAAIWLSKSNGRLAGKIHLYFSDFDSDEYIGAAFSQVHYGSSSRLLTIKTAKHNLTIEGYVSVNGEFNGSISSGGRIARINLKRLN